MSAEEKKFLSGCGCYMRFERKVIHSLDELEKADPARFRRGSALFLWGYLTAPYKGAAEMVTIPNLGRE